MPGMSSILPPRSTYTLLNRFTRMSETVGSFSSGSSGPKPKISSRISRARLSRSTKLRGTASLLTVLRMRTKTSSRAVSLSVRPSFSRSSRSRILRCRSAFTCWYSVFSKDCKFAITLPDYLNRLEQRPRFSLHVEIVFRHARGQSREAASDLGVALLQQRYAPIDGGRHREIMIGDGPH